MIRNFLKRKKPEKDQEAIAKEYIEILLREELNFSTEILVKELGTVTYRNLLIRTIQLAPQLARPYNILGVALETDLEKVVTINGVGQFDQKAAYKEAIRLDPTLERAYCNLANCLGLEEKIKLPMSRIREMGKKELYLKSMELGPDYAPPYQDLAKTLKGDERCRVPGMGEVGRLELFEKYYQLMPPSSESDLIYLVRGTDAQKKAWYYVRVHPSKLALFEFHLGLNNIIHLEEMSSIFWSGYGENPPEYVTEQMQYIGRKLDTLKLDSPLIASSETQPAMQALCLTAEPPVDSKEKKPVQGYPLGWTFFTYISQRKQHLAEALLKCDVELAMQKGVSAEWLPQELKNLTAFQYALCVLDKQMWKTLLRYMSREAILLQFKEWEQLSTTYKVYFNLGVLPESKALKQLARLNTDVCLAESEVSIRHHLPNELVSIVHGYCIEQKSVLAESRGFEWERQKRERADLLKEAEGSQMVCELLSYVAQGKQDEAEVMIQYKPELALQKGRVKDLSNREFKEITGFQYAIWALDWRMWKMLLKYMKPEVAVLQFQELEEKETGHGKHFSLAPLLDALRTYVENYFKWDLDKRTMYWGQQVGGAQLLVPAHVAQEYCHERRSFEPCPKFEERERSVSLVTDVGNWYRAKYNGGKLERNFGYVRGGASKSQAVPRGANMQKFGEVKEKQKDVVALQSLSETCQLQLEGLKSELDKHLTLMPLAGNKSL